MKKHPLPLVLFSLLIISFSGIITAEPTTPPDCYTAYKNRGDSLNRIGNYTQAISQYQAAKYCAQITSVQKKILDDLIAESNKKIELNNKKRVITRSY